MANRDPSGGLLGLLAVSVGLCCGLPILLGTGLAVGAAGLAVGSGLLVAAAGIALGAWAWRRRQRAACQASSNEGRARDHGHPTDVTPNQPGGRR